MIFTILKNIFEDNSLSTIKALDSIWQSVDERHIFYINNIDDIEALQKSEWFINLRPVYREEIKIHITNSVQSSQPLSILKISNYFPEHYSVKEARDILSKPFTLVLENAENDAHFILALLSNFKKKGKKIEKHLKNGWLEFGMGGGSTIPDFIETKKRRFEQDKQTFPKQSYQYLRCFVLIDSDKSYPDEPLEKEKQKLCQLLHMNQIPYHVLAKREMENYLPEAVFLEIPHNDDYIGCYLNLSNIQKDYFDIGDGFSNKRFEQLSPQIQALYENISTDSKDIFRKEKLEMIDGNGNKLSVKKELPKLFSSKSVTQEGLQNRAGSNELQEILEKISKLL